MASKPKPPRTVETLTEFAPVVREGQRVEWGAVAPGWRRHHERLSAVMGAVTEEMVRAAGIRPGYRVLDLACGTGDPAFSIAGLVGPEGRVLGLDLSQEMVEAACGLAGRYGVENAEFRVIPSELDLGVAAGSFDAATCRFGLMLMPEPAAALRAVHEALKPGGRVAVSVWGREERNPNFSLPIRAARRHAGLPEEDPRTPPGLFALSSPSALGAVLVEAGFAEVEVVALETPVARAKSPESWWEGVSALAGPLATLLRGLDEEGRRAVREEVVGAVGRMFPGGPVEMFGEVLVASGVGRA
jgi:SAM-dependent methyltransferase